MYSLRPQDIPFEEDCLRVPNQLRNWTRYYAHLVETEASAQQVRTVLERSVEAIPYCYKLWKMYLDWGESSSLPSKDVIQLFERACHDLSKFPMVWLRFSEYCGKQRLLDIGMSVLDRSLRALPITLHERIWDHYRDGFCKVLRGAGGKEEDIVGIWRRWLQLHSNKRDIAMAQKMTHFGCVGEAASILQDCSLHDQKALGLLLELLARHPNTETVDVDRIIRRAIATNSSRCGGYWNVLAARAIQNGSMRTAQAIFEEALHSISSLEDFCLVFEAFSLFLETLASSCLDTEHGALYLAKLERLLLNRKLLVSNVLIRLQPSNVDFWMDRLTLFSDDKKALINEYEKAVKLINSKHTNAFHLIWISFARLYADEGDWGTATELLEYASSSKVRLQCEDYANLLIRWAELELGRGDVDGAKAVLRRGCVPRAPSYKSLILWNYLLDLQEAEVLKSQSEEGIESIISAYTIMIELKIAVPQTFINYAEFVIQTTGDPARAFPIYERGIAAFGWPVAFEIWNVYLPKAMAAMPTRPLGVEQLRDCFEQALHGCPDQFATCIVLLYCKFEEDFGLGRNVLRILDLAVKRPLLSPSDRLNLYRMFVSKTRSLSDVSDLREVYDRAIKALSADNDALVAMATEWSRFEASLGEMNRTRALLVHVAEQCPQDDRLWTAWEDIEREYGDERSFRDMLRLKKAIIDRLARRHGVLMSSFVPATTANK